MNRLKTIDELFRIPQNVLDSLELSTLGSNVLKKEELNGLLRELLMYFAAINGDDKIYTQLKELPDQDAKWHRKWLEQKGWATNKIFENFLSGRRALAEAKIRVMNGDENLITQDAYRNQFEKLLNDCIKEIEMCEGKKCKDSVEELVGYFERIVNDTDGNSAEDTKEVYPCFPVIFPVLLFYAKYCKMPLELIERIEKLKTTYESVADRKEKRIFQKFDDLQTVGNDGFYDVFFEKLAPLKGNYKTLLKEKKKGNKDTKKENEKENLINEKNIPPGYVRNILVVGGIDCKTRDCIDRKFELSDVDGGVKSLFLDVLDQKLKRFYEEMEEIVGGDLNGRICVGELLNRLILKMFYSCARHVNKYGYGAQPAIKIGPNVKLKDGSILSYEDIKPFLFSVALEAWCYLRGWDSQDLEKKDSSIKDVTDMFLSNPPNGVDTNIPILTFLFGGGSGRNVIDYFVDIVTGILKRKVENHDILSLDEAVAEDEDGDEIKRLDRIRDENVRMPTEIADIPHDLSVVFNVMQDFNSTFFKYFYLTNLGTGSLICETDDLEIQKMWNSYVNKGPVRKEDARVILGIGKGNTNWFKRSKSKLASEIEKGRWRDCIDDDVAVKLVWFLRNRD